MYEYRASVIRVVDGDTVEVSVDLGFDAHLGMKLRLLGINAPEHNTPEGPPATEHLRMLLGPLPAAVTIRTEKDRTEKYGRYLATILLGGFNINTQMVTDGFAVVWDGKGLRPT